MSCSTINSNPLHVSTTGSINSEKTSLEEKVLEIEDLKFLKRHRAKLLKEIRLTHPQIASKEMRLINLIHSDKSFSFLCGKALQSTSACIAVGTLSICTGFLLFPVLYGVYQLRRLARRVQLSKVRYDIVKLAARKFSDKGKPITHGNLDAQRIGFNEIHARIKLLEKTMNSQLKAIRQFNELKTIQQFNEFSVDPSASDEKSSSLTSESESF